MSATHEFHRVAITSIQIPPNRQREKPRRVEELADSIKRLGLLHPIIITRTGVLVAGGCRLAAYNLLHAADPSSPKWQLITAQYADELVPDQLKLIELEENIKRTDLTWQEECCAVFDYYTARGPDYTIPDTARDLGVSVGFIQMRVVTATEVRKADPQVLACETLGAAHNLLRRRFSRAVDDEVALLVEIEEDPLDISNIDLGSLNIDPGSPIPSLALATGAEVRSAPVEPAKPIVPMPFRQLEAEYQVTCGDYFSLIKSYDGPLFNFVHTDFPYGIGYDKSDQGKTTTRGSYEDAPELFWQFIDALLDNQEHIMAPNCHLMVWLSMTNFARTKLLFEGAGFFVNPFPLIWYKSDKIGIVPDVNRRPRQVYEACLLITRGDRLLVRTLPNVSSSPSRKRQAQHVSEKPILALLPFFRMLVDGSTKMLDPTCGGGSSLAAAVSLGASFVRGWEKDEMHARAARNNMYAGRFHSTIRSEVDENVEAEEEETFLEFGTETGEEIEEADEIRSAREDAGPTEEELSAIERGDIGVDDLDL